MYVVTHSVRNHYVYGS